MDVERTYESKVILEYVEYDGEHYTISGRPLPIGTAVQVLIDGRWTEGVVSACGNIRTIEIPQGYGTKASLLLCRGLVARWPR